MKRPSLFKDESWERRYMAAYDAVLSAWPVPYESQLVETGYGATHVLSSGPKGRPPMILLHGAGVSSTMWRPNMRALSAERRVHAVDTLWDLGKGAPVCFPKSHGEATRWFVQVLDALGQERVDLVGLSYGGFLAFRFALDQPHRIRTLTVLAPAASLTNLSGKFVLNALGIIIVPTRPRAICKALVRWSAMKPIDDDLLEQWTTGVRGIRVPTPMHKVPPLVLGDEELRSLRPRTLLLMGEQEWTCKNPHKGVERFRRLVSKGEAEMLEGAGHIVSMDRPQQVCERILAHVNG